MEQMVNLPGYVAYEYRLAICLPPHLQDSVREVKAAFAEKFDSPDVFFGKATITICNFMQFGMSEQRLVRKLSAVIGNEKPIKVDLHNYGSLPSHTIFINVATKTPLQNLIKNIRTNCARLMKFDEDHQPHFLLEPYVLVARKLKSQVYERAWNAMQHMHFSGMFMVNELVLLRRPAGTKAYEVVSRFSLKDEKAIATQTNLFF